MASKRARQEAPQHDDWTLKYAANLSDDIFGSRTGVVRNILWLLEIPIELLENIGEYIGVFSFDTQNHQTSGNVRNNPLAEGIESDCRMHR